MSSLLLQFAVQISFIIYMYRRSYNAMDEVKPQPFGGFRQLITVPIALGFPVPPDALYASRMRGSTPKLSLSPTW